MMKPEEIIAAFLQVWENDPELFLAADVEKDLDSLNAAIISPPDAANEDIAKQIQNWCKKHPNVRDVVRVATRKLKPENNASTSEEGKILDNRYPEISKVLRERLPKDSEEKKENQ